MEARLIGIPEVNKIHLLLEEGHPLLLSSTSIIITTIMAGDPAVLSIEAVRQVETVRPYSPNIKSSPAAPENTLEPKEGMATTPIEENDAPSDLLVPIPTALQYFVEVLLVAVRRIDCLPS
jgi:hypothetical protein